MTGGSHGLNPCWFDHTGPHQWAFGSRDNSLLPPCSAVPTPPFEHPSTNEQMCQLACRQPPFSCTQHTAAPIQDENVRCPWRRTLEDSCTAHGTKELLEKHTQQGAGGILHAYTPPAMVHTGPHAAHHLLAAVLKPLSQPIHALQHKKPLKPHNLLKRTAC
jgi:hypothetical protein